MVWSDWTEWIDLGRLSAEVYAQRVSGSGARIGDQFRVSGADAPSGEIDPAVAYNPDAGEYLIVWEDERNHRVSENDIYGQRVSTAGARVGFNFRVSGKNAVYSDKDPAVAYSPDAGEYLVVWSDDRALGTGHQRDIYGQRVSTAGARVGFNFRVSGKNAVYMAFDPAVAYNPDDGRYLVVWTDARKKRLRPDDVFGQMVSQAGARVGFNFRVSEKGFTSVRPAVAHDPVTGSHLVVWWETRDATRGADIFGQRVSSTVE